MPASPQRYGDTRDGGRRTARGRGHPWPARRDRPPDRCDPARRRSRRTGRRGSVRAAAAVAPGGNRRDRPAPERTRPRWPSAGGITPPHPRARFLVAASAASPHHQPDRIAAAVAGHRADDHAFPHRTRRHPQGGDRGGALEGHRVAGARNPRPRPSHRRATRQRRRRGDAVRHRADADRHSRGAAEADAGRAVDRLRRGDPRSQPPPRLLDERQRRSRQGASARRRHHGAALGGRQHRLHRDAGAAWRRRPGAGRTDRRTDAAAVCRRRRVRAVGDLRSPRTAHRHAARTAGGHQRALGRPLPRRDQPDRGADPPRTAARKHRGTSADRVAPGLWRRSADSQPGTDGDDQARTVRHPLFAVGKRPADPGCARSGPHHARLRGRSPRHDRGRPAHPPDRAGGRRDPATDPAAAPRTAQPRRHDAGRSTVRRWTLAVAWRCGTDAHNRFTQRCGDRSRRSRRTRGHAGTAAAAADRPRAAPRPSAGAGQPADRLRQRDAVRTHCHLGKRHWQRHRQHHGYIGAGQHLELHRRRPPRRTGRIGRRPGNSDATLHGVRRGRPQRLQGRRQGAR